MANQQQFSEVPLREALKALLSTEKLYDLTLKASDGTQVGVQRAVLAARCPVFDTMLYGDFAEASKPVIEVDYDGEVLKAIVEYIYTEESTLIKTLVEVLENGAPPKNEDLVAKFSPLLDASNFFALTGLRDKIIVLAASMIDKNPRYSVPWLAVCDSNAILAGSDIEKLAFEKIRAMPKILVDGESAGIFTSSRIKRILECDSVDAGELLLFKILEVWANASGESSGDRIQEAKALTKYIRLECIDPDEISSIVAYSGLVSSDQICEAYKKQALAAKGHGIVYEKRRVIHVWKSSREVRFTPSCTGLRRETDFLDGFRFQLGCVYEWSILVEELPSSNNSRLAMGVANTHLLHQNTDMWQANGAWLVGNDGWCRDNGSNIRNYGMSFRSGCTIWFKLDLSSSGTLIVGVGNESPIVISDSLLAQYGSNSQCDLVPAIQFNNYDLSHAGCRARFLGFND